MRRLVAVIFMLVVLAMTAPVSAQAVQLVNSDGSVAQPWQAWADGARTRMPDGTFVVHSDDFICNERGKPASAFACTSPDGRLFFPPYCLSTPDETCQRYFWHELGHHIDWQMPDWKRRVFSRIVRTRREWHEPWRDEQSISETFADAVALCAHDPRDVDYTFGDGFVLGQPHGLNARRLLRACRLIAQQ